MCFEYLCLSASRQVFLQVFARHPIIELLVPCIWLYSRIITAVLRRPLQKSKTRCHGELPSLLSVQAPLTGNGFWRWLYDAILIEMMRMSHCRRDSSILSLQLASDNGGMVVKFRLVSLR